MTISRSNENGIITLTPEGWLDTEAAPVLGEAVEEISEAKELILDFEKVEYMSSAGLRQVIAAGRKAKTLGAEFSVIHVGSEVMSIFRMSGIDRKIRVLPVEKNG